MTNASQQTPTFDDAPSDGTSPPHDSATKSRRVPWWAIAVPVVAVLAVVGFMFTRDTSDAESGSGLGAAFTAGAEADDADDAAPTDATDDTSKEENDDSDKNAGAVTESTDEFPDPTAPAVEPMVFTGRGDQVIELDDVDSDGWIATMTHDGPTNFVVAQLDADGQQLGLIANWVGSYEGTAPLNFAGDEWQQLAVTADGNWTITLESPSAAPVLDTAPGTTISGVGHQVLKVSTDEAMPVTFDCPGCTTLGVVRNWNTDDRAWYGADTEAPVVESWASFIVIDAVGPASAGIPSWTLTVE